MRSIGTGIPIVLPPRQATCVLGLSFMPTIYILITSDPFDVIAIVLLWDMNI